MNTFPKPQAVVHYEGKHISRCCSIHVPDDEELLLHFKYPCEELAEERERRVGDDDIGLVAELAALLAAEVAVTFKIPPFKIVEVDAPVGVRVVVEDEYLAAHFSFRLVELRRFGLEEGGLVEGLDLLARRRVAGRDELLQAEAFEVLGEEARELAPLGIVARKQHRLPPKRVGVEVEVGVDLLLDVVVLRVELVVLRALRLCQLSVFAHRLSLSSFLQ